MSEASIGDKIWNIVGEKVQATLDLIDRVDAIQNEWLKPQRESLYYLRHNLGALATGRLTFVPVSTELLNNRHVSEFGDGDFDPATKVDMALRTGYLSVGDMDQIEEHYGLEHGVMFKNGGRVDNLDLSTLIPPKRDEPTLDPPYAIA